MFGHIMLIVCAAIWCACAAFALAALAHRAVRSAWLSINRRKMVMAVLTFSAVVSAFCSRKSVVTVSDAYIQDAGSYLTNDVVHVAIAKRTPNLPDSTEILVYARELSSTNAADWFRLSPHLTYADHPYDYALPNATNYSVLVSSSFVPEPTVHTNGVWALRGFEIPGHAGRYAFGNSRTRKILTAASYSYDSILAFWDGVEHGSAPLVWLDLSGNGYDATQRVANAGWRWDADAYVGTAQNGHGFTTPIALANALRDHINGHTIEIVFNPSNSSRQTLFGQYNDPTGTSGGLNIEYSPHRVGYFRAYYGAAPDVDTAAWKNGRVRMTCAIVCNGTNLLLYENGVHTATSAQPTASKPGVSLPYIIGGENNRANMSIVGELCAVRIYGRALSASELECHAKIDCIRFNLP